jgi:CBS domain-containing protein
MAKLARDIMTANPACCGPNTTLDEVARMMVHHDCGEIPVVDNRDHVIGVITDRDIVCRVVAQGMNPAAHTADGHMTKTVVTVREDTDLDAVISTMEKHQIRRVPVVLDGGLCTGIISQADLARTAADEQIAELVSEVSQDTGKPAQL